MFVKAIRDQAPVRCLGVSLLPLTLGHFFQLRKFDSAFVSGEQATIEDLILGCFVCCQSHEASSSALRSWFLPVVMRLWGWRARKSNLVREIMTFRTYIADSTESPRTVIPMSDGQSMRELNSPVEWRLLVMLMVDFHLTEAAAKRTTMLKANVLWATLGDRDGKINLVSTQTQMLIDMQEQQRMGAV